MCLGLQLNLELGSFTKDAVDGDSSSHLLDHLLADAQPETRALGIHLGVLVQSTEVHEEFAEVLFLDADSGIADFDGNLDVVHWSNAVS